MPIPFICGGLIFLLIVFDIIEIDMLKLKFWIIIDFLLFFLSFFVGDIILLNLSINLFSLASIIIMLLLLFLYCKIRMNILIFASVIIISLTYLFNTINASISTVYDSSIISCIVICVSLIAVNNYWQCLSCVVVSDLIIGVMFVVIELGNINTIFFNVMYVFNDITIISFIYLYKNLLVFLSKKLLGDCYVSKSFAYDSVFNYGVGFNAGKYYCISY